MHSQCSIDKMNNKSCYEIALTRFMLFQSKRIWISFIAVLLKSVEQFMYKLKLMFIKNEE